MVHLQSQKPNRLINWIQIYPIVILFATLGHPIPALTANVVTPVDLPCNSVVSIQQPCASWLVPSLLDYLTDQLNWKRRYYWQSKLSSRLHRHDSGVRSTHSSVVDDQSGDRHSASKSPTATSIYVKNWTFCFGAKWPLKTSNERKKLAERALPCATLRLLSQCACNYLYRFGLCRCARNKGSEEGRKKSQEVYITRLCRATPIGGFQPILEHVFALRTLSNVHNFIVITGEVSELWGVEVSMLP